MRLRLSQTGSSRDGVVLVSVLVVVVLLTLAAYQYSEMMMGEYKAATSYVRAAQARAAAESGVSYAAMLLSDPNSFTGTLGGNPYDNRDHFRAVPVAGAGGPRQAFFSVVAPLGPDESPSTTVPFRYGCADESGKINLNSLLQLTGERTKPGQNPVPNSKAAQILVNLGIPEDIANAMLDWVDINTTPRPNGAKDDYYSPLGYQCKNGPLDTLEELLYVRGVTADLLFGNDANRNGILDPEEAQTGATRNLGWQAFLTVYSREQNVDSDGNPRLYINTRNTRSLYQKLTDAVGQDMANYLLAYRKYGPAQAVVVPAQPAQPARPGQPPRPALRPQQRIQPSEIRQEDLQLISGLAGNPGQSIPSLFALINTEVKLPPTDQRNPRSPERVVACPLNDVGQQRDLLPKLLDKLTTTDPNLDLPARINVNTAPQAVLAALPGLAEADVQAILTNRPDPSSISGPDPIFQTPAWLLTEAHLKPATLQTLDKFITARTQVYRVQVVGHYEKGGPAARVEAVIDTNRGRPRIVYFRDLTSLGRGFNLSATGAGP